MKAINLVLYSVFSIFLAGTALLPAQDPERVPKLINYQGKLTDAEGVPLGSGAYVVQFELFEGASGGVAVWTESQTVSLVNGVFHVALGSVNAFEVETFGEKDRYLETTIVSGPDIAVPQTLSPRQQMVSVPFAVEAQRAERAILSERAIISDSLIEELAKALNPPGTIITYAGAVGTDTGGLIEPVPGYLLCNGAVIDGDTDGGKYSSLLAVLGNTWGNGGNASNAQVVNLPDLRGVFLRGWNGGATDGFADPDRNARMARRTGANTGNNVGSYQMDAFKSHRHIGRYTNNAAAGTSRGTHSSGGYSDGGTMDFTGGSETRGKNANVVYLIKY